MILIDSSEIPKNGVESGQDPTKSYESLKGRGRIAGQMGGLSKTVHRSGVSKFIKVYALLK